MADNLDKGLDADILQCRMDILRIRQSIVNSRSGEAAGQEVRAADTAAGVAEEIEKSEPAQKEEAVPAPLQEPAMQENPYAVTRDEIDALLKSEATDSPEVAEEPSLAEEDDEQVIDQADALFGDDVIAEQIEEYPDRPDDVAPAFEEVPQVVAQPADEAIEAAPAEPAVEEAAVTAELVEAVADTLEMAPAVAEDKEPVPVEETGVETAAEIVRPDIEAPEPELSEMVAEAEEWMAQIAPEEEEHKAVVGESEAVEDIAESVAAEPPAVEEAAEVAAFDLEAPELEHAVSPSDFDIDSPVLEDTASEAVSGQFDEVVSRLHGEEAIVPVEEDEAVSPEVGKVETDVNLRIIQDMKGEGQKGDEERAGIPRLDLSESDLAGILESRRNAAATRKGPGKKEKLETGNPKIETIEEESEILKMSSETEEEKAAGGGLETGEAAQELPMATEAAISPEEERRMDKERQIVARIVAMDIERFCASAARLRQKERAGQR